MNIFFDVDDVVLKWHEAYISRYNLPMPTSWIPYEEIKDHLNDLSKDRNFWLSLKVKHKPNFTPAGYVSARGIPVKWTRDTLKLRQLPGRSKVYHVKWGESKMEVLKSLNCDIFIDDKIETFEECWKHGIFCLLMDTPQNRSLKTQYRIKNLKLETIMKKYHYFQKIKSDGRN